MEETPTEVRLIKPGSPGGPTIIDDVLGRDGSDQTNDDEATSPFFSSNINFEIL